MTLLACGAAGGLVVMTGKGRRAVLGLLMDLPAPSGAGLKEVPGLAGNSSPRSQSFDADLGREEEKQL